MAFAFRYTDTEVTGTGAIVALRIWKIVRIMHAVAVTINRGHRKLLTAILDSNSAIASACRKPLRAFEDGKDTFFRGLRKLERDASGWGVERRRSARCDKREEGPGSSGFGKGSSSRLDAVQPAKQIQRQEELRTMAMMMDEAGLFMDTLQMALREMEVQVAAANKRRLDTAIQNAHLTGEEARDGEGLVLEEEELFRHHLHLLAEADGHHHSSPGKEKNDEVREGKFLTA
ncbi:hypothetical protein DFJ73DRAFT_854640 [Zopfochytrium polystomum]|nr:hypothetical protein DFJ73DRAFT_854640 [Zopfochytrium polystomum]